MFTKFQFCMLKQLFFLLFLSSLFLIGHAQKKDSIVKYPLVVKFASVCCGVPSDSLLKKEIKSFKKRNKIKSISADKISPMGREGEYWLGFSLREVPKSKRKIFIEKICAITSKMNDKGNAFCEKNVIANRYSMPGNVDFKKIRF